MENSWQPSTTQILTEEKLDFLFLRDFIFNTIAAYGLPLSVKGTRHRLIVKNNESGDDIVVLRELDGGRCVLIYGETKHCRASMCYDPTVNSIFVALVVLSLSSLPKCLHAGVRFVDSRNTILFAGACGEEISIPIIENGEITAPPNFWSSFVERCKRLLVWVTL